MIYTAVLEKIDELQFVFHDCHVIKEIIPVWEKWVNGIDILQIKKLNRANIFMNLSLIIAGFSLSNSSINSFLYAKAFNQRNSPHSDWINFDLKSLYIRNFIQSYRSIHETYTIKEADFQDKGIQVM